MYKIKIGRMSIKMLMMKLSFGISLGYALFNLSFFVKNIHYFWLHLFIIPIRACKRGAGRDCACEWIHTHTNPPQIRKQNKKKPLSFKCKVLAGISCGAVLVHSSYPGNAVVLGILFFQTILLQRFRYSKVCGICSRQQDCLVWNIWF